MRVVFVCATGLGHVYPLARAAVAAGDDVLFGTAAAGVATVEAFARGSLTARHSVSARLNAALPVPNSLQRGSPARRSARRVQ